jgi:hypothetical protein
MQISHWFTIMLPLVDFGSIPPCCGRLKWMGTQQTQRKIGWCNLVLAFLYRMTSLFFFSTALIKYISVQLIRFYLIH